MRNKIFRKQSKTTKIIAIAIICILIATNLIIILNGLSYKSITLKVAPNFEEKIDNVNVYNATTGEATDTYLNFSLIYMGVVSTGNDYLEEKYWGGVGINGEEILESEGEISEDDDNFINNYYQKIKIKNTISIVRIIVFLFPQNDTINGLFPFYSSYIELFKSTDITLKNVNLSTSAGIDDPTNYDMTLETETKKGNFIMDLIFGLL